MGSLSPANPWRKEVNNFATALYALHSTTVTATSCTAAWKATTTTTTIRDLQWKERTDNWFYIVYDVDELVHQEVVESETEMAFDEGHMYMNEDFTNKKNNYQNESVKTKTTTGVKNWGGHSWRWSGFQLWTVFFLSLSLPLQKLRCLWVCPPPPPTTKNTQEGWSNTGRSVVQLHTVLSLSPVVWLCVGLPQGPEDCRKRQQWYQQHLELCWWWPLKMMWLLQQACPVDPLQEFGALS